MKGRAVISPIVEGHFCDITSLWDGDNGHLRDGSVPNIMSPTSVIIHTQM